MRRVMARGAFVSVVAASALGAPSARGDEAPAPVASPPAPPPVAAAPSARPEMTREWYGMPLVVTDVLSVAAFNYGLFAGREGVTRAGVIGYLFPTIVVHGANGQIGKGFGAFGIRLGLPPLMGLVGLVVGFFATSDGGTWGQSLAGAAIGAYAGLHVGILGASIIDVGLLAQKKVRVEPQQGGLRLVPTLSLARDAGDRRAPTLGVAGAF